MHLAIVFSRALLGIQAPIIHVEVHLSRGLPNFTIVGLPETSVKESKDRVRSAILNSQYEFPLKKIVVNLAPADIPKEGTRFDLAIAVGILAASGQIRSNALDKYELLGELSLTGNLTKTKGVIPATLAAQKVERQLIIPVHNQKEVASMQCSQPYVADSLFSVVQHLNAQQDLPYAQKDKDTLIESAPQKDIAEIDGQYRAKRALIIAAAGRHSMLMVGPPGSGKTMLAERLPGISPKLSASESMEVASIYSVAQGSCLVDHTNRPFRAPHHSSSAISLIGGGAKPHPGEITLAHNGILFLDELPEFNRRALEGMREPLEKKQVTISRANYKITFPACFQLIAAMNPCPCGKAGDPKQICRCRKDKIKQYQNKISGPLLDRIDLHIEVPKVPLTRVINRKTSQMPTLNSANIGKTVANARNIQLNRAGIVNADMSAVALEKYCKLTEACKQLLNSNKIPSLSVRGYHRILKISRTIADIENEATISTKHLAEAISYKTYFVQNIYSQ